MDPSAQELTVELTVPGAGAERRAGMTQVTAFPTGSTLQIDSLP